MLLQIALGLLLSGLVGYLAYRRRSLSRSGLVGAVLVGTLIFGLGGWAWGVLLVVFFVSSSALSHFKEARKAALAEKFSKGSQRDLAQVLANGGLGALLAVLSRLRPDPIWWWAFAGAMATVNADTWSTELGVLSREPPRLITTGQAVPAGTSGGITSTGSLAALAGSGLVGAFAAASELAMGTPLLAAGAMVVAAAFSGVPGALLDSFLGATLQAIFRCDRCGHETERHPFHTCGGLTRRIRGWGWLNNDWVNFLSSFAGAGMMGLFGSLLRGLVSR